MAYRSSEKTRKKKDAKRTAMMQAAMKVFAEKGYHASTVRDVVKAANVAIGTFYFYFPDKETLFTYLYEETAEFMLQTVQQGLTGGGDFPKKVSASVQSYLNLAMYEPAIVQLLLVGGVGAVPSLQEKRMQFRKQLTDIWQRVVDDSIIRGELPEQISSRTAEFIAGGMDEIVLNVLNESNPNAESASNDIVFLILQLSGYRFSTVTE